VVTIINMEAMRMCAVQKAIHYSFLKFFWKLKSQTAKCEHINMLQTITGCGDIRLVQTTASKLNQTDTNY